MSASSVRPTGRIASRAPPRCAPPLARRFASGAGTKGGGKPKKEIQAWLRTFQRGRRRSKVAGKQKTTSTHRRRRAQIRVEGRLSHNNNNNNKRRGCGSTRVLPRKRVCTRGGGPTNRCGCTAPRKKQNGGRGPRRAADKRSSLGTAPRGSRPLCHRGRWGGGGARRRTRIRRRLRERG